MTIVRGVIPTRGQGGQKRRCQLGNRSGPDQSRPLSGTSSGPPHTVST